jgi:L-methionine (R)-S-oxide reductase
MPLKKQAANEALSSQSRLVPPGWPVWPVWYDVLSPLGSAVHYVASLSPQFNWVGIYVLKGNFLELGPFMGAESEHTRIRVGQGVCGTAVAEDADQNISDVRALDNYLACSLETRSELVVLIRDTKGKILGQIDIDSHTPNAFGPAEEEAVKKVADELGVLWPA